MSNIDLQALIPNNVHLGENRQLQRAPGVEAGSACIRVRHSFGLDGRFK